MKTITVEKDKLLETMRANRDQHQHDYIEAMEVFRKKVQAELSQRLKDVAAGKDIDLNFSDLPQPQTYVSAYETAIQMVEWEQASQIVLDQQEFQRYVQNQWEWSRQFMAATASYLG